MEMLSRYRVNLVEENCLRVSTVVVVEYWEETDQYHLLLSHITPRSCFSLFLLGSPVDIGRTSSAPDRVQDLNHSCHPFVCVRECFFLFQKKAFKNFSLSSPRDCVSAAQLCLSSWMGCVRCRRHANISLSLFCCPCLLLILLFLSPPPYYVTSSAFTQTILDWIALLF